MICSDVNLEHIVFLGTNVQLCCELYGLIDAINRMEPDKKKQIQKEMKKLAKEEAKPIEDVKKFLEFLQPIFT